MGDLTMTLAEIIRSAPLGVGDEARVDEALRALGRGAEEPLEASERAERERLVVSLVRELRARGVSDAAKLERQLLRAVSAMPRGEQAVRAEGEGASAAVRRLVRYYSVCIGMDWAEAAALQSVMAELTEQVARLGGGELSMAMTGLSSLRVRVTLGPSFEAVRAALEQRAPWASSLAETASRLRVEPGPSGGLLELWFDAEKRPRS